MDALIFDIDGTLLQSDVIDSELYMAAVEQVLGKVRYRDDWSEYTHVTDTGILMDILHDNGINAEASLIEAVQKVFFAGLGRHIEEVGPFREVPGARDFVAKLCASSNRRLAYATGGWGRSAEMKLKSAGFPMQGIPLSTSDDSVDRCVIMLNALNQLSQSFETITYYGDGAWDQAAANKLGWRFVPVGAKLGGMSGYHQHGA